MGLDMYLYASRYLSSYNDTDKQKKQELLKMFPELENLPVEINQVRAEVGYWRKANQIHSWFVKNVQNDRDDCGYYYLSRETLLELRDLCEEVLSDNTKAAILLPTQSGFFFGGTDYDECYLHDLECTINIIDNVASLPGNNWEFQYHSSW